MMINFKIIENLANISEYKDAWDSIFNAGMYEVSTSYEWTNALLKTHLKKNDTFTLILQQESDAIIGILPLLVSIREKFGQKLTTIFPISEYYNTHSDFLLQKLNYDAIVMLFKSLFEIHQKWDVFSVRNFLASNHNVHLLETWLEKSSLKYEIKQQEPSFFINLDNTYEEYLKKRSSKFRNYLRRMEKKLSKQGKVSFTTQNDYADISVAYTHLMEIEENSWKHSHGTAISSIPKQEEFYKILIEGAYPKGYLHLLFLWLQNRPIAYNLGLIKNNTYSYLKTSFSEAYRKLGPSTVLRAKLIQSLIENGIKYFDFPGEPYEWEKQWTDDLRWHKKITIYNNTLKAKFLRTYLHMAKKTSSLESGNNFQYYNPRDLKPGQ